MRVIQIICIAALLGSCGDRKSAFSERDLDAVNQIRRDYINGWLAGDSETVLGIFAEDATIIPSGVSPIVGKGEIKKYWFPNNGSETIIHSYEVDLLELHVSDSMAYSLEKGTINFTYTFGEVTMTKETTSYASSIFRKKSEDRWEVISRMWTTKNE
ncbi:MAG: nuclear transport factor 2 family protein [Ekhidna sp.]